MVVGAGRDQSFDTRSPFIVIPFQLHSPTDELQLDLSTQILIEKKTQKRFQNFDKLQFELVAPADISIFDEFSMSYRELCPGECSPGRFSFETMVARWAPSQLARKRAAIVFTNFVLRPTHAPISPLVAP
jgi:hypothetical protein